MSSKDRTALTMLPELAGLSDAAIGGSPAARTAALSSSGLPPDAPPHSDNFIGTSPVMQKLYEDIERAAPADDPVLIIGEAGTGKQICAATLHRRSPRRHGPFVIIDCAATPGNLMEGRLFGYAEGALGALRCAENGVLVVENITAMPPDMQLRLLRFLQTFSFVKMPVNTAQKMPAHNKNSIADNSNVRIICTMSKNPLTEIQCGHLREDLYRRLSFISLSMPPLRARGGDIIDIAQLLLQRFAHENGLSCHGFTDEAEWLLRTCSWPGNVRQLKVVIQQLMSQDGLSGDGLITAANLLPLLPAAQNDTPAEIDLYGHNGEIRPLALVERDVIERALRLCGGNIPRAASHLGLSPSTLYRKKAAWDTPPIR